MVSRWSCLRRRRHQRILQIKTAGSRGGRGPLDHLPDVGETVPGASASSPALLGGGGEDASGPTITHPEAEADTPEARALGKRVVSLVGSAAEVEQVAAGAMQLPL